MYYEITGLCPRLDLDMGGWGFGIRLWPKFKEMVAKSGIDATMTYTKVARMGRFWLDGCRFNAIYDPDVRRTFPDERKNPTPKPGPNARPMYQPNLDLRVTWGEWGIEHINVPGNACGLDLDDGLGSPIDGRILVPHNIDSMAQAMLCLTVFTSFAESIRILAKY